jgi:hypothetical protein|tara:strand:- start:3523 stop:4239 length:717 start_codon:yes stop_codon:yes gene_type:complete
VNFSEQHGIEIAGIRVLDKTLIRLGWILPLVSIMCSMSIHALSGHARDFPFFVSESDYPGLERWFFTTGLALTSPIVCILSHRFNVRFKTERTAIHEVSLWSGIGTGVALFILAFANMYDQLFLHSLASISLFVGGFVWGVSINSIYTSNNTSAQKLRRAGILSTLIGFIVMNLSLLFYGLMLMLSSEYPTDYSTLEMLNQFQPAINIAAPAEYLLIIGLMITLASIGKDFNQIESLS